MLSNRGSTIATGEEKPYGLMPGLAYAAPMIVTCFLFVPVQSLLAGMYARYFGLSLTVIASAVLAARLFDAFIDPLIGYCSDRFQARFGTRKPWIVAGNTLLVVSGYFLFIPPDNVGVGYFLGWYFAFYLAFTMADIPHYAWGGEIANSSHEKKRLYSLRVFFWFTGSTLYAAIPLLPYFGGEGFTPQTLKWSVLASAVVLVPLLVFCVRFAPDGRASVKPKKESVKIVLGSLYQNKPLLNFLSGVFLFGTAFGMKIGLTYFLVDGYMGLGGQLPLIYIIAGVISAFGAQVVYKLPARIENKHIYILSLVLTVVGMAGLSLMVPGEKSFIPLTFFISLVMFANAISQITLASLLSNIADYGCWKFKADRAATYFAIYTFLVKASVSLGVAVAMAVVGWYGFDASAATQSDAAGMAVRLMVGIVPAVILSIALLFAVKMPINTRRHSAIRRRISLRLRKQAEQEQLEAQSFKKALPIDTAPASSAASKS